MAYEDTEKVNDSDEDILSDARKYLREMIDEEAPNRAMMQDDQRFADLDQWPTDVRNEREGDLENGPRPCLTIDKLNQYLVQVVNDIRQGRPGINVRPQDDAADVETAKILKGLIRNIEDQSKADIAYATAAESAAKIGLGYIRVTTEYVSDDSFDQDIFIRPIANTFSVYMGKHVMPDGSDSERCYIAEEIPLARFEVEYPGKKSKPDDFDSLQDQVSYWHTGEAVTVVEEYCIYRRREMLLYLEDGTTMTQADYDKWPEEAGPRPAVQDKRSTMMRQLKWRKMTGIEVLDKRDLPGKHIPVVEVVGRVSHVDGRRVLWGLVRPAKDSLRMYNYWASTLTEKFGLAPKTPFIGAKGQFEGLEDKWKKANRVNFAYLEYNPVDVNGNALPRPERQGPTPMEAAYFQQMQVIEHDVQTSLGMFKAATGESESQQSGRAILALQKESDTGTYHFGANVGVSIRQVGIIVLDMIPHYYDTRRIVRILGEDGEVQTAILDPNAPKAFSEGQGGMQSIYNPNIGKYDISITSGPSYNTKRMEAQATFVEMAKGAADPASAAILRYLVMRNSDAAGSDEASKLLKTMLPPQALQAMATKGPIPPQAQAALQQMQAQMQQMQQQGAELQQENIQLKAGAQVQVLKVQADAQAQEQKIKAEFESEVAKLKLERDIAMEKARLAREEAVAEAQLKRDIARAEHQARIREAQFEREQMVASDPGFKKVADTVDSSNAMSESLEQITSGIEQAIQVQTKVITAMVQQISAPKTVKLEGIQRDEQGIKGAMISVESSAPPIDIPALTVAPKETPAEVDEAPEVDITSRMDGIRSTFDQLIAGINQSMAAQTQALSAISQEIAKPTVVSVKKTGSGASATVN